MLGGGGEEVSVVPVVYNHGRLVSHHLVLFRLLVIILNFLILLYLSLSEHSIFKSISRIGGVGK